MLKRGRKDHDASEQTWLEKRKDKILLLCIVLLVVYALSGSSCEVTSHGPSDLRSYQVVLDRYSKLKVIARLQHELLESALENPHLDSVFLQAFDSRASHLREVNPPASNRIVDDLLASVTRDVALVTEQWNQHGAHAKLVASAAVLRAELQTLMGNGFFEESVQIVKTVPEEASDDDDDNTPKYSFSRSSQAAKDVDEDDRETELEGDDHPSVGDGGDDDY